MSVENNLKYFREELPSTIKLVAVSKFKPDNLILEAYNAGQRDFGENRPQELSAKMERLPSDIRWHFIGRLQSNKIKMIIDKVYLIHSVDSFKLISEISKEATKRGLEPSILIQQHISDEDSKQGFSDSEMEEAVELTLGFGNIKLRGIMGMASLTENSDKVRDEFSRLKSTFERLKSKYFLDDAEFCEISMGMSGDYRIAAEEGSTIVRIGTSIFGERE
ncbi:Pyridoxal phosphate homeostasis protein [bioreactor metagenome]|uniref:Pyridoxal phosphate homeostasis protein n=1 Tax=bioreactor metagenome TaxID=1076179 RepID=A0A644U6A4_9ZZZZ|nr:YggS family pyridoxal phosphate-dependent enzyme [Bacteroidales bacterium]MBP8677573.1 YggS family pyridoxal phosphate-dependent enzyme [Bacteroidales bacterium]MBP9583711.1 YggS family pyridoxal phosphate-dependent enzyme [Bacteroidales bacterium]MBP9978105.1 YggS family pyridoxal phosphate-dependent enzyme [Bacteroidales bacterium]